MSENYPLYLGIMKNVFVCVFDRDGHQTMIDSKKLFTVAPNDVGEALTVSK